MERRRSNSRPERYSETRRFGQELERLLEDSRYSRRGLGEKLGRDGSTVAGWCKGRTLPETPDDIRRLAKLLDADPEVLDRFADFDEAVYSLREVPMSEEQRAATIRGMKRDLEDFLRSKRGVAAAAHQGARRSSSA